MALDASLIARRRHAAQIILRAAILALAAFSLFRLFNLIQSMYGLGRGGFDLNYFLRLESIVLVLVFWAPYPTAAVLLYSFERRMLAWLVPAPSRHACPACGYDVRYATGGRCPECGLTLDSPPA